ncbi:MAG: hypothetical protein JZU67_00515, partial [Burkholderiaceae bacterium]|nr:hypothetical protein [Burkholderiaceae bacterium]
GRVKSSTYEVQVGDYGAKVKSYTDPVTGHKMVDQTIKTPKGSTTETHDVSTSNGVNESWAGDVVNNMFPRIGDKIVRHNDRNRDAGDDDFDDKYGKGRTATPPRRDPLVLDLDRDGLETVMAELTMAESFLAMPL